MKRKNIGAGDSIAIFLLTISVFVFLASSAFAQSAPPPPQPDLTIRNQGYSPDVALIDQPVTISFDVHNKGNLECGYSTVAIICNNPAIPSAFLEVKPLHPNEFDYMEHIVVFSNPGTYQFTIIADYYDEIDEKNENDNQKNVNVEVYDPGADLIVESLTHDPDDPNTSDTITIKAVVKNVGETSATASVLEIVVWVDGNDYPTTHPIPVLVPGEEFEAQRVINNPLPECYTIYATADVDDEVWERIEDNNTEMDYFCVRGYGPDLIVALSNDPLEPTTLDNPTTIVAEVKNIGNEEATSSTLWLQIFAPGIPNDQYYYEIPPLGIGESYFIYYGILNPLAGDYSVWAEADYYDDVMESAEDNNDDFLLFTIRENKPDLIVESVIHAPDNPTTIDMITITAVIKNDGITMAGASTAAIKAGTEALPITYPVPALAPDETFQIQRQLTLGIGVYLIEVTADYDDDVDESNENNNTGYDALEVVEAPLADLVVSALDHDPANPNTDDMVTITAIVENIGGIPAGASVLLLEVDGEATTHTIPALNPAETYQVNRDINFPVPGDYDLMAFADLNDDVEEMDENNNAAQDTITVTAAPRPDLIVESLTHDPLNPTTWDDITITAIVKNIGDDIAGTSTLAIRAGGETLPARYPVPPLAPDETFQVQRVVKFTTPLPYQITATADVDDDVEESNEDNNVTIDVFWVVLPDVPDLAINALSYDPETAFTSETITITAEVMNIGTQPATTFTLCILVGDELIPECFEISGLDPGTTTSAQRQIIFTAPGSYMVTAIADADDDIEELNEDNNTDTIIINVYQELSIDRLKDYLLGRVEFTEEEKELYDINKDGIVNIADLISMLIM